MRELSNVIERAVLLKAGSRIEPNDLALGPLNPVEEESVSKAGDHRLAIDLLKGIVLEDLERTIIEAVLARTGWNRTRAAQLLGLSRETLRYRIEKHNQKGAQSGRRLLIRPYFWLLPDWRQDFFVRAAACSIGYVTGIMMWAW